MTAPAPAPAPGPAPAPASVSELGRAWRVARTSALYEVLQPGRLIGALAQLATQVFLVWCLWTALYEVVPISAGLDQGQAVTYAVVGALYARLRGPDRVAARDTVLHHVRQGSVVYWYLRPLAPRSYHWMRAVGDQAYGLAWTAAAFVVVLGLGVVQPPASGAALAAFAVTTALGQVVLYQLLALVDVACFWTINNGGVRAIVAFAQNLFAGAIAPLWFFPGWFQTLSGWLPFQTTLHVPLSFYIGRISTDQLGRDAAVQVVWIAALGVLLHLAWKRADAQVVVQGG
ncbi:ABC transporter permease [Quadrisphaera setariae]|uniref:ABC-2 type transport system permease protein n=1 Tax=Quadrisphaera setariae TaxID=2593304 RepID=A0A5C8Z7M4_9ACTN|nr:hypothetical protein [Quadrisphaera setariae]TXR52856.1 hypothetical protein FMM08_17230 [Quadrisphaera setariae]